MLEPPQYPQSMFWSKNKKKVYPWKPQFYYIKEGCTGVYITRTCLHDGTGSFFMSTAKHLRHPKKTWLEKSEDRISCHVARKNQHILAAKSETNNSHF